MHTDTQTDRHTHTQTNTQTKCLVCFKIWVFMLIPPEPNI